MEDKNKKPVDSKQLKKPTGKSATGKPLDGINVKPQLQDGLRNEDADSLTNDTLQEKKALTLAQRQKRARIIRSRETKMERAKEIAKTKLASSKKLEARAMAAARQRVRNRFSSRKGIPYAQLSTSEKIQVDSRIEGKDKLIKKIAKRLLPKIRRAEYDRLQSFRKGEKLQDLSTQNVKSSGIMPKITKQLEGVMDGLTTMSTRDLIGLIESTNESLSSQNNPMGITLNAMLQSVMSEDPVMGTLIKKSNFSGIDFSTLSEVFERGLSDWKGDGKQTQEQYAFNRVNSYISGGKAWKMDADLRETKENHNELDNAFSSLLESKNTPYVKPHIEKGSTKQIAWKASNKHGKVKYFGLDFKKSAEKHAGISEQKDEKGNTVAPIGKHGNIRYSGVRGPQHGETGTQERQEVQYTKRHKSNTRREKDADPDQIRLAQDQIKKKIVDEDTSANREIGTKSLTKKYKKDTPGQDNDLNESFKIAYGAGIGLSLTASDLGMNMESAFKFHPSVISQMEEERENEADFRMVKVRTPKGWIWKKYRKEADVERDAE